MLKPYSIAILFFLLAFTACSPLLYIPSAANETEQKELLAGRKLYVSHCGGCHNLHLPKEFDAAGWNRNISEMQVKAKISDDEKQVILKYLTSYQH
jgi:hypothetical protein